MSDLPLHPTLFFSLSIILGLVLSYFFTVADLIDKKDKKFIIVNLFLYGSWTVAAIFAVYIVHLIETDHERAVPFAPLSMMIAALIASASVMKNIAETKANDIAKSEKEKERKRIFALNVMKTIQLISDAMKNKISLIDDKRDMEWDLKTIEKLINSLFLENILPFLSDEEQKILSKFYFHFYKFLSFYEEPTSENETLESPLKINRLIFTAFSNQYIALHEGYE